jgi:hypothetical protein
MAKNPAGNIIDIGSTVSDLDHYYFLGVSGAVTMTGFFVDVNGDRARKADGTLSPSFTGTIPAANPGVTDGVSFATVAVLAGKTAANYPSACGWIGTLSGAVYFDIQSSGVADADFKTNPTRYAQISAGNLKTLSRVA